MDKGNEIARGDMKQDSPTNNTPRKGVIHMIVSRLTSGGSHRARKKYARNCVRKEAAKRHQIMKIERARKKFWKQ